MLILLPSEMIDEIILQKNFIPSSLEPKQNLRYLNNSDIHSIHAVTILVNLKQQKKILYNKI